MEHELSLLLGPVQNQILPFRGTFYARYSRFNASLPQAYQENALDLAVGNFCCQVSISAVRECVTKIQNPSELKGHPNKKYNFVPICLALRLLVCFYMRLASQPVVVSDDPLVKGEDSLIPSLDPPHLAR